MPLNTEIRRNGETMKLNWGQFHVACMVLAAAWDSGEGPIAKCAPTTENDYPETPVPVGPGDIWSLVMYPVIASTPLNDGAYVLKGTHRFSDPTDGEILELLPGDELSAWRD